MELIDKQAAIDEAEEWIEAVYCDREEQRERSAIKKVIQGIKCLPSVQLATDTNVGTKLGTNLAEVGTDCISRQDAIDALDEIEAEVADGYGYQYAKWREYFAEMPSAQPEIIRCKDCRYYNSEEKECLDLMGYGRRWEEDDFCSYAERREVTT